MTPMSVAVLALLVAAQPAPDLAKIASEPDLVKRARLALTNAERATTAGGDACRSGDHDKCSALLSEVQNSVELAQASLQKTGIDPARSPRHFKDAEIRTRKIMRLLDAVGAYVHSDDASHFDSVRRRVSEINDQLLSGIMSKRKRRK